MENRLSRLLRSPLSAHVDQTILDGHEEFSGEDWPTIDLPDQTVFVDGLDPDEILVDLIFTAVAQEAPFEIAPISELITGLDSETLEDRRRQLLFEESLEPQLPENGVYALLLMAREEGLFDED